MKNEIRNRDEYEDSTRFVIASFCPRCASSSFFECIYIKKEKRRLRETTRLNYSFIGEWLGAEFVRELSLDGIVEVATKGKCFSRKQFQQGAIAGSWRVPSK